MNTGLFSTVRKPLNILCGGIGGTGNRKGAGTWRNDRVITCQITGNYSTRNLCERIQGTQVEFGGGYINVQYPDC